jgi:hypothetical protein
VVIPEERRDRTVAVSIYADECRARIVGFARRHFTWPGTFRLHRAAFGLDILRAPANAVLSPLLVATRLLSLLCGWLGLAPQSRWLAGRRILLRTAVSRQVEALAAAELLALELPTGDRADPEALTRAVLASPRLRELIRGRGSVEAAETTGRRIAAALGDYVGTRSAVAEMTTALGVLVVGAFVYRSLTPGLLSMAPGIASGLSWDAAVAGFPLGQGIGRLWYGVFPVGPAPGLVASVVVTLVMLGAVLAALAGTIADPVQVWLGVHRRRLTRLIGAIEAELGGDQDRPFGVREHYLSRLLDLWDVAVALIRGLRG